MVTTINIKEAVQEPVNFVYFRDGCLWYETCQNIIFPVPVEDAGSATFSASESGMYLMRWMRKYNRSIIQQGLQGK